MMKFFASNVSSILRDVILDPLPTFHGEMQNFVDLLFGGFLMRVDHLHQTSKGLLHSRSIASGDVGVDIENTSGIDRRNRESRR